MSTQQTTTVPRYRDWVSLTKPGIVTSNVLMAAAGLWLAPAPVDLSVAVAALVGTGLLVAGSGAFNQVLERDTDRHMPRTAERPLPSGRLAALEAVLLGVLTVAGGAALLGIIVNPLSCALGLAATFIYAFVYTPMKRRTFWAVPIGAVAGALPPMMGWTAATGQIDPGAVALFGVLFWWQMPHFLGISIFRAKDYFNAGLRIAPRDDQLTLTVAMIRASTVLLIVSSLLVALWADVGPVYLGAALLGGLPPAYFAFHPVNYAKISAWARRVFFASLAYLPLFALCTLLEQLV